MSLISRLSDKDLLTKTKWLAKEEKRITQDVLDHLTEIEYRKLHLQLGFPSLLDYCVKELRYSESSAQRRISAMRLIRALPEAREKLEHGSVNLSTLTQLNSFIKREEKEKIYTKEMKLELLGKIENKSQDQCEREFVKISPFEVTRLEKSKPVTQTHTQVTLVLPNELIKKLEELKNLTAHRSSCPTTPELLEIAVDMALRQVKAKRTAAVLQGGVKLGTTEHGEGQEEEGPDRTLPSANTRYVPAQLKRYIWQRDQGQCQYTDKETKKKCQSQHALQIDHIQPFALGGPTTEGNLRLLCRAHNMWRTEAL